MLQSDVERLNQELSSRGPREGGPDEEYGVRIRELEAEVANKLQALASLADKREALQAENNTLQRTIVHQAAQLVRNDRSSSVPSSVGGSSKSIKILDPAAFSNGKDPTFEDWLIRINDKLTANANHFHSKAQKLAYMKSRCTGKAAKYILARCRPGAANPYNTIKDLTDHLTLIY